MIQTAILLSTAWRCSERQGRMDAVLPLLRKLLVVEPESSHASFNLALFLKNGEPEKARCLFQICHSVRDCSIPCWSPLRGVNTTSRLDSAGKRQSCEQAVMTNAKTSLPDFISLNFTMQQD